MHKHTCIRLNSAERGTAENAFTAPKPFVTSEFACECDRTFTAPIPPVTPELSYTYDGTFEGWLCCVAESYESKEIPGRIRIAPNNAIINDIITEESLFYSKKIYLTPERIYRA